MAYLRIYEEDLKIASSLLNKDEEVIRKYLYVRCWPLFKSIFDNYYTDCDSCVEFIHEIYTLILTPSKLTGHCQLENYRGESTLTSWLKAVCLYYCYRKYKVKGRIALLKLALNDVDEKKTGSNDRKEYLLGTIDMDFSSINRNDAEVILNQMPNRRYRELIRLRYLEQRSNEETAKELGMSMDNYYNKHRLAKAQYELVCKKEVDHEE